MRRVSRCTGGEVLVDIGGLELAGLPHKRRGKGVGLRTAAIRHGGSDPAEAAAAGCFAPRRGLVRGTHVSQTPCGPASPASAPLKSTASPVLSRNASIPVHKKTPGPVHSGHGRVGSSGLGGGQREAAPRRSRWRAGNPWKPMGPFATSREAMGSLCAVMGGPWKSCGTRGFGWHLEGLAKPLEGAWQAVGNPRKDSRSTWNTSEGFGERSARHGTHLAGPGTHLEALVLTNAAEAHESPLTPVQVLGNS